SPDLCLACAGLTVPKWLHRRRMYASEALVLLGSDDEHEVVVVRRGDGVQVTTTDARGSVAVHSVRISEAIAGSLNRALGREVFRRSEPRPSSAPLAG